MTSESLLSTDYKLLIYSFLLPVCGDGTVCLGQSIPNFGKWDDLAAATRLNMK